MTSIRRLLGAAGATALLILGTVLFATISTAASGEASTAQSAPQNTASPTVSGSAREGETLTTSNGRWTSASAIAYSYQWQRCDAKGTNCANIAGKTTQSYVAQTADVGATLRALVSASNADGVTTVNSLPTPVVVSKSAPAGPRNTASPVISGSPQEGATLTTSNGQWSSASAIAYSYQWQRCDAKGASCADIAGKTTQSYVVQSADVGKTLRATVAASNADGVIRSSSAPTAVVTTKSTASTGPAGQIKLANGKISVPVSSLALPSRLVLDDLRFTPSRIVSRQPFQMQVHVSEMTTGYVVRDALVYVNAVPFARIQQPAEVRTNQEGWATLTIQPTARLPLQQGYLLTMFARARKEGENVLSGISTRRLVSLRVA
jgi:hypothetical protein